MDPASILMCVNIPRGITEDILCELFCVVRNLHFITIQPIILWPRIFLPSYRYMNSIIEELLDFI